MRIETATRAAAWAIVVLSVLDPGFPIQSASPPEVAVLETGTDIARSLERMLEGRARVVTGPVETAAAVVYAGARPPEDPPWRPGATLHVVDTGAAGPMRIARVAAPTSSIAGLSIAIAVELTRDENAIGVTHVALVKAGIEVARTTYRWTNGQQAARVELSYLPLSPGTDRLRVEAATEGRGSVSADLLLNVRPERVRVNVISPRAAWALRFIRQALEQDDRLTVSARVGLAPGIAITSTTNRAAGDADVMILGGLDRLSPDDIRRAREHAEGGGAVVLVPDTGLPAELRSWVGTRRLETRLLPGAATASNGLRASEWLFPSDLAPQASVMATVQAAGGTRAALTEMPFGRGSVLYCAALDAWRFRAEPAFARFWSGLVVEAAARLREQRAIRVEPAVVRPLESVRAIGSVRLEADSVVTLDLVAPDGSVTLVTGIALDASTWEATFHAPAREGVYRLRQRGVTGTLPATFEVATESRAAVEHDETSLRLLAAAHGGLYVRPHDLGTLAASLRGSLERASTPSVLHPMRWRGWAAIFAVVLGTEWWIRRRRGLR